MEDKTRKKRYLHQANAIAAWGHITRPFCEPIPTQAALALPVTGGDGSPRDIASDEPEITTLGSRFERLRIGNHFFEELDLGAGMLCDCVTWKKLQAALQDGAKRETLAKAAMAAPNGERVATPDGKQMPNSIGFSLAPGCGRAASIKDVPWRIPVEQVGTVYLGEFFVSDNSRQLVMLRVQLGCPLAGA